MNEQKKPFDTVSIVLLLLFSGVSDIADLLTDFVALVPVIGQVIFLGNSLILSPVIWAVIQISFIMKTGMGRASLIALIGGLGNIANIPGSETITTGIAIVIANNSKLSGAASMASEKGLLTGGAIGGAAAGRGEKTFTTTSGTKVTVKSGGMFETSMQEGPGGSRIVTKYKGGGGEVEPSATGEADGRGNEQYGGTGGMSEEKTNEGAAEPETGEDSILPETFGESPGPMEELREKLFKETPRNKKGSVRIDDGKNQVDLRN